MTEGNETDSQAGALPDLTPLVQSVVLELERLGEPLGSVDAILAIGLADELSGYLVKGRAVLTKELRSVMAEIRERHADVESEGEDDAWLEAVAALSEPT